MTSMQEGIQWLLRWGAMGWSGCAGTPPTAALVQAELAVQQASKSKAPAYVSLELSQFLENLSQKDSLNVSQFVVAQKRVQ
jgi:hypothetical protein